MCDKKSIDRKGTTSVLEGKIQNHSRYQGHQFWQNISTMINFIIKQKCSRTVKLWEMVHIQHLNRTVSAKTEFKRENDVDPSV